MREYRSLIIRSFKIQSGNYYIFFICKENEKYLELDIKHDSGELNFVIKDTNTGEVTTLTNPDSGIINIPLIESHKYQLVIHSSKACGGYKIRVKK